MSENYDLILRAIKNKQQIVAVYDGHKREMCPHALGIKNGRVHALFYQFGGTSSSATIIPGSQDNWRCISVDGLSDVNIREGEWHTAQNHSKPQTCVDEIHAEVRS